TGDIHSRREIELSAQGLFRLVVRAISMGKARISGPSRFVVHSRASDFHTEDPPMSRSPLLARLALRVSIVSLTFASLASSQAPMPPAPMINLPDNPALTGFRWRSVGPIGQGGRVDDFAVDEKNPSTFYIGFA